MFDRFRASGWNETDGANRFVMIGVAVALVALLIIGMVIASNLINKKTNAQQPTTTTTEDPFTATTAPRPFAITPDQTVTTLRDGMTEFQLRHPEGAVLNAAQLEYRFSQRTSGLTTSAYAKSVEVAKAFALSSATGEGESAFKEFYSELPNSPWVDNYEFIYATTMETADPTVIKAMVWWTGKEKKTGLRITQARHTFLLKRASPTSLDIKPYSPRDPVNDNDLGIQIVN